MDRRDNVIDMQTRIEEARQAEAELLPPSIDNLDAGTVTPAFVRNCLYNNIRGDGLLFAAINRDKFVHVKNTKLWMAWTGHHWKVDRADYSHDAVERVAELYLEQAMRLKVDIEVAKKEKKATSYLTKERDKYLKRIDRLRGDGASKCLDWSHKIGIHSLSIEGEELDQKPWLLPCKNGVINLRSGELQDGVPGDYLQRAVPVDWEGLDAPCPAWEQFVLEIHENDQEVVDFVRRLFGYAITGLTIEHFIGCFVGEGRNGKGTMFETLRAILGELAWAIQPELILEQKNARSSAGPSPDLISLQGRRLVIASETDEHRRVSGSKIKQLTGGDTINARAPHDRFETNFKPTHTLFLYTNHVPKGLTSDFALLKRLLFLNYPLKFVDDPDPMDANQRPRDPRLPDKLASEHAGILAWLVRGCLEWQLDGGLNPPAKIRGDIEQLRVSEDTFQQFFNDHLQAHPEDVIGLPFKQIYGAFAQWYKEEISDNDRYIPSRIKISKWLEKKGYERARPGGTATVFGLKFTPEVNP